ncbi:MAG: ChaN family lipoprotein [Desulfofustis sp.]
MSNLFNTIFKYLAITVLLGLTMHTTVWGKTSSASPIHIDLAVSFDIEENLLRGSARIEVEKNHELQLLFPELQITAALISSERRENAPLDLQGDNLELPAADENRTVLISYEKRVQKSFSNIISDKAIILTANWHPLPRQKALYSLSAQLPEGFIGLTQADELAHADEHGQVRFSFSQPLYALTFISAPYVKTQKTIRDDLHLYTLFFKEDQDLAPGYLEAAADYVRRYERLIGPFPYNHYVIAENIMPTGYGYPTFTLLGQQVIRLPFIKETSLGHEILHSWFGNSIDIAEGSGNWSEGLTTYLADMAYRSEKGEGPQARKEAIQRYQDYVGKEAPLLKDFYGAGHERRENQARRAVGYQKSAMLFHELYNRVGEETFYSSLQEFGRQFTGSSASWLDLQQIFEDQSSQDLNTFFSERLGRNDLPVLRVGGIKVNVGPESTTVSLSVEQAQSPAYELLLPVSIETVGGTQDFQSLISESETLLSFEVDSTPLQLTIDPDYDLLRALSAPEKAPVWSSILGAGHCLAVLDDDSQRDRYEPLISFAERYGCRTIPAAEFSRQDLETQTVIFLGSSNSILKMTYGDPGYPSSGFTADVRPNPFNDDLAVALISASSRQETEAAVARLSHYGKYSYLHFVSGRISEKRTPVTAHGIRVALEEKPAGLAVAALAEFDELVDQLSSKRVVYVGETHTSRPDHLLQRMLIEALHSRDKRLAIGMEMFPRSSQPALDRFINDPDYSEADFLRESKYYDVWRYDYRLFRPIFAYARKHGIPVIGLNIDRQITSSVFKTGDLETLTAEQRTQLPAEMRLDLEGYVERLQLTHQMHGQGNHADGSLAGFIQAQALWDETMAETIATYLEAHPQTRMVVLAGNQHTRKDSGIPPRVAARLEVTQSTVQNLATTRASAAELARTTDYLFLLESVEFAPQGKIGVVLQEKEIEGGTRMEIVEVNPQSKAKAAGIEKDDILIFIDELAIHTMDDVRLALLDKAVGETVRIAVLRGSDEARKRIDMDVELYNPTPPPGHP